MASSSSSSASPSSPSSPSPSPSLMVVVVVVLLLTVGSQCSLTKSTTSPGIYIKVSSPLTCNGPTAATTTTTTSTSYNTTSSRFGIISSPKRLGQIMCSWDIVNPQRETLLLSFTQFDLSDGPCMGYSRSCCSHWLSIYASGTKSLKYRRNERPYNHLESTLLQEFSMGLPGAGGILGGKRLCGSDPPAPVVTQASRVLLRYSQEAWIGRHSPAESGFRMVFFALTNGSTCEPNEITCSTSTLCLPRAHLCDGQVDCPDHSDEMKCPAKRQHAQKGCGADEWYCGVGQECYTASQRCDGTLQCSNAVDELSCNTKCQNEVACWGGGCYPFYQRCDGSPDCGDASDEANCSPLLCNGKNGTFLCNNRRCIRETWRCDQLDDCRDGSDEQDCLRNSVIGVAAMGGLMCSLMLVVAVGCTGRLYALKMGLTRLQSQGRGRGGGQQGGEGRGPPAPRSRLEEHLLQREMPPSYDVAVNDASSSLFGMWGCHRPWRRPSMPQERDQTPPSPRVPVYGGTPPLEPRRPHPSSQLTGEEVEKVEEGGDVDFFSTQEEDVPLLTNLVEGGYHGDEERRQQEEEEEVVEEEEEEEEEEADDVPLLLDLISTSSTSISSSTFELDSDEEITNKRQEDVLVDITRHPPHLHPELNPPHHSQGDDGSPAPPPPSSVFPEGGDVLSDTRAAVLALSAVQSHMDSITHSDTELISQ